MLLSYLAFVLHSYYNKTHRSAIGQYNTDLVLMLHFHKSRRTAIKIRHIFHIIIKFLQAIAKKS
jgi:hypothetical protein